MLRAWESRLPDLNMAPKIVIIDPNSYLAEALTQLLRGEGWEAELATSLIDASKQIESLQPHVVLAGIEYPMQLGVAFAKRVRQLHDGKVLLIAMSSYPRAEVKKEEPQLFDLICHKPIMEKGLGSIVKLVVDRFPALELKKA